MFRAHLEVAAIFLIEMSEHADGEVRAEAEAPEHRRDGHEHPLAPEVMVNEKVRG